MTNKSLESIIDRANSGGDALIFTRAISDVTDFARVWMVEPSDGNEPHGYEMFLVKQGEQYGSVYLDMGRSDFHVFTKPSFRRTGNLKKAVLNDILPFLKTNREREGQSASFRDEVGERFLNSCGFEVAENCKAHLSLDEFSEKGFSLGNRELTKERIKHIKSRCRIAASYLRMVADECEGVLPEDMIEQIMEIGSEAKELQYSVEEYWWDNK